MVRRRRRLWRACSSRETRAEFAAHRAGIIRLLTPAVPPRWVTQKLPLRIILTTPLTALRQIGRWEQLDLVKARVSLLSGTLLLIVIILIWGARTLLILMLLNLTVSWTSLSLWLASLLLPLVLSITATSLFLATALVLLSRIKRFSSPPYRANS